MELDLGLAASFLVLMEEEHFGRAADRLFITPSTLAKRVQRLEHQLGVALIDRNSRGVLGATPAGLRFAEGAGPLVEQAAQVIRSPRGSGGGSIRVGVPAGTGEFFGFGQIPEVMRRVCAEHPASTFRMLDVPFPELRRCLDDRKVDLLFTIGPVRAGGIDSIPIPVRARRVAAVHRNHRYAGADTVHVEEFAAEKVVFNPGVPDEFMNPFWLGDVRPAKEAQLVAVRASDLRSVLGGVADGAVLVSLDRLRRRLDRQLVTVPLAGAGLIQFHAARRREDRNPVIRDLFLQLHTMEPVTL